MTDRMAAMGEIEKLVAELRARNQQQRERGGDMMTYGPDDALLLRAADYLESLSAPVEDEEKVCREILADAVLKLDGRKECADAIRRGDNWTPSGLAALSAMREYARRLRAPADDFDYVSPPPKIVGTVKARIQTVSASAPMPYDESSAPVGVTGDDL